MPQSPCARGRQDATPLRSSPSPSQRRSGCHLFPSTVGLLSFLWYKTLRAILSTGLRSSCRPRCDHLMVVYCLAERGAISIHGEHATRTPWVRLLSTSHSTLNPKCSAQHWSQVGLSSLPLSLDPAYYAKHRSYIGLPTSKRSSREMKSDLHSPHRTGSEPLCPLLGRTCHTGHEMGCRRSRVSH